MFLTMFETKPNVLHILFVTENIDSNMCLVENIEINC